MILLSLGSTAMRSPVPRAVPFPFTLKLVGLEMLHVNPALVDRRTFPLLPETPFPPTST